MATIRAKPRTKSKPAKPPAPYRSLDLAQVRKQNRGALTRQPITTPDVYVEDVADAVRMAASSGDYSRIVQIMNAVHSTDAVYNGAMEAFVSMICQCPLRFTGDADVVAALSPGHEDPEQPGSARSLWRDSFSTATLASLLRDGREYGCWLGELNYDCGWPQLIRHDPEWLRYRRFDNVWTYQVLGGETVITPGDGQWFFGCPGGNTAPFQNGIAGSVGTAWAEKRDAMLAWAMWRRKLAGAARVGFVPVGATAVDAENMLDQLIEFAGQNSTFVLPIGYDCKLLESQGQGYQVFLDTVKSCNESLVLSVQSQLIIQSGSPGFGNSNVAVDTLSSLASRYSRSLADDLNAQCMPFVLQAAFGPGAYADVEFLTDDSAAQNQKAQSWIAAASVITALAGAVAQAKAAGIELDPINGREILRQLNIPVSAPLPAATGAPQLRVVGGTDE